MFVRIIAAVLIWIEHREGRRRSFVVVGKMMIRDNYIEPIRARPMQRFVRAYSTIDADDQFVTFARGFFQCRLLNAITFSEAMRHVITGGCSQHSECT